MPALADLLLSIPAVLWAITFHEFCHGYMAYRLGDPTAARMGRL
ncbi:MAG TPA: site-2 protease family protein, partial [Aminivibrio sp.]|nr:site-2 protease family protein [Aminivibrio sp.]